MKIWLIIILVIEGNSCVSQVVQDTCSELIVFSTVHPFWNFSFAVKTFLYFTHVYVFLFWLS